MGTYLIHHGVKGMKWGVRRYQNEDGTRKNPFHEMALRRKARKENERQENEKRLRHPKSRQEAEEALKRKIQSDLESEQGTVSKVFNTITGQNRGVADYVAKRIISDSITTNSKEMRSSMSNGQKFMDTLTLNSIKASKANYENGGYKKLSKNYTEFKKNGGLDKAKHDYQRQQMDEYWRKQRQKEFERRRQERYSEQNRNYERAKAQTEYDRSRGIVNEYNIETLNRERKLRGKHLARW